MSAKVKLPDPLDKLLRSQLEKVIEEAAFHTDDELIARRRIMISGIKLMWQQNWAGIVAQLAITKSIYSGGLRM